VTPKFSTATLRMKPKADSPQVIGATALSDHLNKHGGALSIVPPTELPWQVRSNLVGRRTFEPMHVGRVKT
jgi:hypothetical protein